MSLRQRFHANPAARLVYRNFVAARQRIIRLQYGPILSATQGNAQLANAIHSGAPFGAGKIGSVELEGLNCYLADPTLKTMSADLRQKLYANVGVFPQTDATLQSFFKTFLASLNALDVAGVWYNVGERAVLKTHAPQAVYTEIRALEPYYHTHAWSHALQGKTVLLISPFTRSCASQYAQREKVWASKPNLLPEFTLNVLRAPLSPALVPPPYASWDETLTAMQAHIQKTPFDIALIGVGGYSLPLVAYCKSLGKQAIHMGGSTQVLFGVAGARWDKSTAIGQMMNTHWVAPSGDERPENVKLVERGCYW